MLIFLYASPFVRSNFTSCLQFRSTETNVCLDKSNPRRREHSERNDTYQESNNHFVGQVKACNNGIDMFDKKIGPAIYSRKYVAKKKSICRVQKKNLRSTYFNKNWHNEKESCVVSTNIIS